MSAAALRQASSQQAGSGTFRSALLQPALDTVIVTAETSSRVIPVATALESLRRVSHGKAAAWEQVYQWFGNDGSRTADTLWFDATTLAPLENHRHNGMHDAVTTFVGSVVHSRITPRGGAEHVTDTTVAGPVYASGELAVLIRASPLTQGYSAQYNLYYGPPHSIRQASFRVTRSERVSSRAGESVECWVIDAPLSEGLNTFYISKEGRREVRLVNHEDPSAAFVFTR